MSGLRCWPGCLAYIVAPWANTEHHGVIVAVGKPAVFGDCAASKDGGISRATTQGRSGWFCDGPHPWLPHVIADECLRPITPPPGTDCTTTDADKPQPVEAA